MNNDESYDQQECKILGIDPRDKDKVKKWDGLDFVPLSSQPVRVLQLLQLLRHAQRIPIYTNLKVFVDLK